MIELKVFSNADEALAFFGKMDYLLAPEVSMSLNRATHAVRTAVRRRLVKRSGGAIERAEMGNDSFTVKTAKPADLEANATITGKRLPMEKFVTSPMKVMGGRTKGGVQVNLNGQAVSLKKAFLGRIPRGSELQVWQRNVKVGDIKNSGRGKMEDVALGGGWIHSRTQEYQLKGRFPVAHLTFMAIPQIAEQEDVVEYVVDTAQAAFIKQFDHQMDRIWKGMV